MGSQICPQAAEAAEAPREGLRFHAQAVGAQVRLDAQWSIASRRATFHDGIVFSHRPVQPGERVALRLLQHQHGWMGGLRVGFTRLDPARVPTSSLPPFLCPDLEQQSQTWAGMLPDGCASLRDVVCFWVNHRGQIFAQVNAGPPHLLRQGVLLGAPLWAVMDVYGTTKAIQLLDPTDDGFPTATPRGLRDAALPGPKALAGEACAICFHKVANTSLLPCGHMHFCSSCAWSVFRDTARCPVCHCEIKVVAPAWDPHVLGAVEGLLV